MRWEASTPVERPIRVLAPPRRTTSAYGFRLWGISALARQCSSPIRISPNSLVQYSSTSSAKRLAPTAAIAACEVRSANPSVCHIASRVLAI